MASYGNHRDYSLSPLRDLAYNQAAKADHYADAAYNARRDGQAGHAGGLGMGGSNGSGLHDKGRMAAQEAGNTMQGAMRAMEQGQRQEMMQVQDRQMDLPENKMMMDSADRRYVAELQNDSAKYAADASRIPNFNGMGNTGNPLEGLYANAPNVNLLRSLDGQSYRWIDLQQVNAMSEEKPVRMCQDCAQEFEFTELNYPVFRKARNVCVHCVAKRRSRKKAEENERRKAVMQKTEEKILDVYCKEARQGGSKIPHSAELLESCMDLVGGVNGLSALLMKQLFEAPPGGAMRSKALEMLTRLVQTNTEVGGNVKALELWREEELEEELELKLKEAAQDFQLSEKAISNRLSEAFDETFDEDDE